MFTASLAGRPVRLLLAVAFLVASAANPYAAHACPMHGGEGTSAAAHAGTTAAGPAAEPDRSSLDEPEPDPGSDTCRCLGDCHSTAVTPLHRAVDGPPPVTADVVSTAVPALRRHAVRGRRHLLFELHLPNAPPLSS